MAEWKKIITSGSNAELNQLTASAINASAITLPNDAISGDVITGGTIGSTTITALAGNLSLGDNNITNVGDINADSISVDAATAGLNIDFSGGNTTKNLITLQDNLADALNITEGSNSYIKFTTTNSSEKILVSQDTDFTGNVSGSITSTGSFGLLQGDGSELTGVQQDIDTLDAFSGVPHATQDEFLISDNGTEKRATMTMVANGGFALVSGDATIAAGGALTIADNAVENDMMADNAIGNAELKQNDDITLQSLTTTNNVTVGGDLTVNGTTTTIATTNTKLEDQFMFLGTGSAASNKDIGIIAQSGSAVDSGSAFYHDINSERWSVAKGISSIGVAATPLQFVTTVKTSTSTPGASDGDFGIGEMWVDTDASEPTGDGVVYIRTA
tara:strand:+ start:1065 stop:2228 length:1164 start_codon:yes stop_codon:yes gene_type:complete